MSRPSYRTVVEAREALKAAGVANVTIGGDLAP
jgi:hypothetical protein